MTAQEYLESVLTEIDQIKARGSTCFFHLGDKVPDEHIHLLESYFLYKTGYWLQTKKCSRNGAWEVIIKFAKES